MLSILYRFLVKKREEQHYKQLYQRIAFFDIFQIWNFSPPPLTPGKSWAGHWEKLTCIIHKRLTSALRYLLGWIHFNDSEANQNTSTTTAKTRTTTTTNHQKNQVQQIVYNDFFLVTQFSTPVGWRRFRYDVTLRPSSTRSWRTFITPPQQQQPQNQ